MALDLEDNPTFLRQEWLLQRIGWGGILLILIAGATGLAGRGPLGRKDIRQGPLTIRYDRVMRHSAPGTIVLDLERLDAADTMVRIWADQALIDACRPKHIMPSPIRSMVSHDTLYLDFAISASAGSASITVDCEPDKIGRHTGSLGLSNGPGQSLQTLVLP